MPTNLELKARVHSLSGTKKVAGSFARFDSTLSQTDTYFCVREGRLKLRVFSPASAELIVYARNEGKGDRYSRFDIFPTGDSRGLFRVLKTALGIDVQVKKTRLVYRYQNARIHIDAVRSLGAFIEFEVMVTKGPRQAKALLAELRERFGIADCDCISCSYADLIRP
ncbi:MAG: class IV adenylate cyclase [Ignavibacteriales bacterium]|nr:class IV adenylate cyclase [Ignavibacteriales bacterium]